MNHHPGTGITRRVPDDNWSASDYAGYEPTEPDWRDAEFDQEFLFGFSAPATRVQCGYCKGFCDPFYGEPDATAHGKPVHSQCLDDERIAHTDYEVN